jgi:drug/metabolite transporter (DMT)-like permease
MIRLENQLHLQNQPAAGALCVLGSSLLFAIMGALVKEASASLGNDTIVFFRNFYALIFILPLIFYRSSGGVKTKIFRLHLLRSCAGLGAMYCFFYAISQMHLAEAVLLSFTAPLFIPMIAYFWLGESVSYRVTGSIFIGFLGVLLIIKPGTGLFQPVAFLGLASGIFVATAMVTIRRMSASEPPARIVFYFSFLATLFSGIPMLRSPQFPRGETGWVLVFMGLTAVGGQILVTKGYSLGAAAQVGPFGYGVVIFSAIIARIFWGESLDLLTCAGAFLICIAGILTAYRSGA